MFILATTDPQKVLPTIRSRTQHFEFHLLPADVLADHVRYVIDDAGLGLGEDAVDHVVRQGGGSARDTLSALDQVSAMGGVVEQAQPVEAILDALAAARRRRRARRRGRGHRRRAATPGRSARCSSAGCATRSSP